MPLHERAIELDPDFAMAHASLGIAYSNLGESSKSMQHTTRAYQLRHRATDRERYFIETMYDRQVTGNLEKEQQTLESWAQTYPREAHPHGLMAGFATTSPGNFETSIEAAQKAIGLDPDMTHAYASLAFSQLHLGRPGDAEATLQRASARKLEANEFSMLRYFIALVKGDSEGMKREVALAKGKRGLEDWISHADSLALARSGRLQEARRVAGVARDLAHQAGHRERAAMFESGVAVWESFYGNAAAARQNAFAALELTTGRDVTYAAAFALALSGEVSRARALADDLEKRFPEDTSVRFSYVPTLRALFSLSAREPAPAVELLKARARFDRAMPGIAFDGFFGALHGVYVRGLAHLAAREPVEAAAEFQKILDQRGLVLGDPTDAMARLQLGRALAQSGDTVKARAAYEDFLNLWSGADPGTPILEQAKAEYARLALSVIDRRHRRSPRLARSRPAPLAPPASCLASEWQIRTPLKNRRARRSGVLVSGTALLNS